MTRPDDHYVLTILGCGSSGGVPRIGGNWGNCDPENPLNRRRRCSLLVQRFAGEAVTSVLVDTSPDCRTQLLDAGIGWLDAVVITHEHADHTHGIDDLRVVALNGRKRVKVMTNRETAELLRQRFSYCFVQAPGSSYPPILDLEEIGTDAPFRVDGPGGPVTIRAFDQIHGDIMSLGLRIGGAAYSSDLSDLPDESLDRLNGLNVWIVDALRHAPHPSHFSLADAIRWIDRLKPVRAILTNLHTDLDHDETNAATGDHVMPAHDMMQLIVPANE